MGFGETKPKRLTSGQKGHLKRNSLPPLRFLREFRVQGPDVKEGDTITVEMFTVGENVDITGTLARVKVSQAG
jgi:large subunit ribosomal protein L3